MDWCPEEPSCLSLGVGHGQDVSYELNKGILALLVGVGGRVPGDGPLGVL